MAGDWIKVEHVTADKPEVVAMAHDLEIDQDSVFGKLIRIWVWADSQSLNGHALTVTKTFIDRLVCHAGFATAMENVGWLSGSEMAFSIPNFDRHNGETAKARALASKRKRSERSRAQRDKNVTRVERREEIDKEPSSLSMDQHVQKGNQTKAQARFTAPTLEQVKAYCQERGNNVSPEQFIAHYESNGWMVGRNKMKNWKFAVHTWEGNNFRTPSTSRSDLSGILDFANGDAA